MLELEEPTDGASRLGPEERARLGVRTLARDHPVVDLARVAGVSPRFAYEQADLVKAAVDRAFRPDTASEEAVLFTLHVTRRKLCRIVLGLVLICRSSLRGVREFMEDILGYKLAVGTVFNIVHAAVEKARVVNASEDLSRVRVGALDEIFQNGKPILVGVCAHTTYAYCLSPEEHRDGETWKKRLLDLQTRGFNPKRTIADSGSGLRAGQAEAMPGVPCDGDVFHALWEVGKVVQYAENRAYAVIGTHEGLEQRMNRAKQKGNGQKLSKRLALVRVEEARRIDVASDLDTISGWIGEILALEGPDYATRRECYDFLVEELRARETFYPHIARLRVYLENQRDDLLAFALVLDTRLEALAKRYDAEPYWLRAILQLNPMDQRTPAYWQRESAIRQKLGGHFHALREAVTAIARDVVRASSLVENLNSRLRRYIFLGHHLSEDYLDLLRFFFNHRTFLRSDRPERVGKSPVELLTGERPPHWSVLLV
jgi:hypothetical protein